MASSNSDDDFAGDTALERAAHYWKKAADMYSRACKAESDEVKALYIQMAMSWAAMADEVERPLPEPIQDGDALRGRH
jgi:hypothetical protein